MEKILKEGQVDNALDSIDTHNPNYPGDVNIAGNDQNLSVQDIFQQTQFPSLAKQVCSIVHIRGTTGGIFNVREKEGTNDIELVRRNFAIEKLVPIKTRITQEAVEDIKNNFGYDARMYIGTMLRSMANNQENQRLIKFCKEFGVDRGTLTVQDPQNAETNFFNLTLKIHQCILEANAKNIRTFESWAIVPYKYLAAVVGIGRYAGGNLEGDNRNTRLIKIGLTNFYINPDVSDQYVYVGLKDKEFPSRSSIFFGEMASDITSVVEQYTGQSQYFIWNRFGLGLNPLHTESNPMLFKFKVEGIEPEPTDVNDTFNRGNIDPNWGE